MQTLAVVQPSRPPCLRSSVSLSVAGFNAGIQGRMTTLTLVLTGLMTVIIDFDRSLDGMISVNQQTLEALIQEMETGLQSQAALS